MIKARTLLNQNSAAVTIVALVVLIVALYFVVRQLGLLPGPKIKPQIIDVYYFDLNTGKHFYGKNTDVPPIPAPSGDLKGKDVPPGTPSGVHAHVFSCGDCDKEEDRYIGWLEMYTPEARQAMIESMQKAPEGIMIGPAMGMFELQSSGKLIRSEKGEKWVPMNSTEGYKITSEAQTRCGPDKYPTPCFPGMSNSQK